MLAKMWNEMKKKFCRINLKLAKGLKITKGELKFHDSLLYLTPFISHKSVDVYWKPGYQYVKKERHILDRSALFDGSLRAPENVQQDQVTNSAGSLILKHKQSLAAEKKRMRPTGEEAGSLSTSSAVPGSNNANFDRKKPKPSRSTQDMFSNLRESAEKLALAQPTNAMLNLLRREMAKRNKEEQVGLFVKWLKTLNHFLQKQN